MAEPAAKLHGVQVLAPANPSVQIVLPDPTWPDQRVWFHWSDIGAEFDLCNGSADTAGVPVAADEKVSGPYRLSNAPTYCYAASATAATVAIMIED